MKSSMFKSLSLGLLTTALMTVSVTHAATQQEENINVTPTQKNYSTRTGCYLCAVRSLPKSGKR